MSEGVGASAVVIAIGSELLTPHRRDTNSLFITDVLNGCGIAVIAKRLVGDDEAAISRELVRGFEDADLVVTTGGLGPTDDDMTRGGVARALGVDLDEDAGVMDAIRQRFAKRGVDMPSVNRRQALVPRGARVLANPRGTAPGLWFEAGRRWLAVLPGPPREMRPMLEALAAGPLAAIGGRVRIHTRVLKVAGRSESAVEQMVQPVYSRWLDGPRPIATTILASPARIELHLSRADDDERDAARALDTAVDELAGVLGDDVYSRDGRDIEAVVGSALAARGLRIALAESCTGGLATSWLTDVAGSSAYVERAVVAYSNEAKVELLGVPPALIAAHGAVSEPVAASMAQGVRDRAGVDVGVGITGIAGPGGGTAEKPVGTVCIAVAGPDTGGESAVRTFGFRGERGVVKTFAAFTALDMVRRRLGALERA